jgi:hypothetical protein
MEKDFGWVPAAGRSAIGVKEQGSYREFSLLFFFQSVKDVF